MVGRNSKRAIYVRRGILMSGKQVRSINTFIVSVSMLCDCSVFTQKNENNTDNLGSPSVSKEMEISEESIESAESEARFVRPLLIESVVGADVVSVSPNVVAYGIKSDLGNVVNYE